MQRRRAAEEAGEADFIERVLVPTGRPFLVERHVPTRFREPYHHHTSVEINFLDGVDMTYSFSGDAVAVPRHRLVLFWAAAPHRVEEVAGPGRITNIYLPLATFLRWSQPAAFVEDLAAGCVLAASEGGAGDLGWLDRLVAERDRPGPDWQRSTLARSRPGCGGSRSRAGTGCCARARVLRAGRARQSRCGTWRSCCAQSPTASPAP